MAHLPVGPPVIVVGAGFTQAFFPRAPLLRTDKELDELEKQLSPYPAPSWIFSQTLARGEGTLDIESLLTRFDGGMPYDDERTRLELQHGMSVLLEWLTERLTGTTSRPDGSAPADAHSQDLDAFARYCVENRIPVVTFNYDDGLDRALWNVQCLEQPYPNEDRIPYWHPNGGYGFFCRPAESCVWDHQAGMFNDGPVLLKLHGSVNWRIKKGSQRPYPLDAFTHLGRWLPFFDKSDDHEKLTWAIQLHLEPRPFIVPPVLSKSVWMEEPILKLMWSHAQEALEAATSVTFVGYSIPATDFAATSLFSEIGLHPDLTTVVNLDRGVLTRYCEVLPGLQETQLLQMDAREWTQKVVAGEVSLTPGGNP